MLLFGVAIFWGAFLLFSVQPLLARYILPWFGGQPGVWSVALLFFQVALLAGYAYAYGLTRWFRLRTQVVMHSVLLLLAVITLPIIPAATWKPAGSEDPTARILLLLLSTVGAPYLLLASTAPLLQAWFSARWPQASPYRLYALSNAASLLALLGYPLLIEPAAGRNAQALGWSFGFAAFALVLGGCAVSLWRMAAAGAAPGPAKQDEPARFTPTTPSVIALWILLPATASLLLLAITNQLTQDVAAIPFLWVLPLLVYLLSFILVFAGERWYARKPFLIVLVPALLAVVWLNGQGPVVDLWLQLAGYLGALFLFCMVAHGELARLKPEPRRLTGFYLAMAAGGALGGGFVALLAPRLFNSVLELPLGLLLTAACVLVALLRDPSGRLYRGRPVWAWALLLTGFAVLTLVIIAQQSYLLRGVVVKRRNFFGVVTVLVRNQGRADAYLTLRNGVTDHGIQYLEPAKRSLPTTYYSSQSGAGLALGHFPRQQERRIGMIGLGVGTLAAYGRSGDYLRVYEINPDVVELAATRFSYLQDSKAKIEIVPGDARLSLEREAPQQFDVLLVDAFSSDAIPVHLLTREAFELYLRHLKPDGILAMHVTNRHLRLAPVVVAAAAAVGWPTLGVANDDAGSGVWSANWVLLTRSAAFLGDSAIGNLATTWRSEADSLPRVSLWTDDRVSVLRVLRF